MAFAVSTIVLNSFSVIEQLLDFDKIKCNNDLISIKRNIALTVYGQSKQSGSTLERLK